MRKDKNGYTMFKQTTSMTNEVIFNEAKKHILFGRILKVVIGLALFIFMFSHVLQVNAAEEIDAYCVAPKEAVPHGSTIFLTIKFSDNDKSNNFIVQGPFKILKYENGKPIIVDFKRANDKDDKGKENPEKPTLTFNVVLSPKHKLPAPATESATFTYFVKHKEGKRGELSTTDREQQVDCSFTVQHEAEKSTTPSESEADNDQKNIIPSDLGIKNIGTLPTSPFYFFKEWRRGIGRLFTFNPVAKAELELKIANEKAVEVLKVEEAKPNNSEAIKKAIENYTNSQEKLKKKINSLKETSKNPNIEKLLEKLDSQTLKHAILFNQLAERWSSDPYVEDANVINPKGARDNHLQGAVDTAQKKIQEIVVTATEKDKNIKEKADEQIKRAASVISKLELGLAEFAINEPGVPNKKTDPNVFSDRMKAGLETAGGTLANAKTHLASAKTAFADVKFGEAFGQARAAEVLARNGLRVIESEKSKNQKRNQKSDTKEGCIGNENESCEYTWQSRRCMSGLWVCHPASLAPDVNTKEKQRVFPETNNRTACDDRQAPGCLRGEILECHNGKWVCIGPATGGGININEQTSGVTAEQKQIEINTTDAKSTSIAPTSIAPTFYEFTLEADDSGFYPNQIITVPKGSRVKIHFIVRTSNVYYGGLDFRSSKFKTESVKPGATTDVEFIADESFAFTSYWPLSNVQKTSGSVIVK